MKLFNKVAIIGMGLVGGSLALAIRKRRIAKKVVGVSRSKQSLALAKKLRAIDAGSQGLDIIRGSDLVIIATPVNTIISLASEIAKHITSKCIVSDVGSTKASITKTLGKIFPRFIGAHPLAGSEKRGVFNADGGLFRGAICIITPFGKTDNSALAKIKSMWKGVGSRVVVMPAAKHDTILSFLSHLPHAIAFSLINTVPKKYLKLAPNSLRDMTRIAASDAALWQDIMLSNRSQVIKAIKLFQKNLLQIESALKSNNQNKLSRLISEAKSKRENLK